MREIKFRAWDKWEQRMTKPGRGMILDLRQDRHEVMQYTGLKDKNGVEIYEGDIVRRVGGGLLGSSSQVLFTGEVIFTNAGYKAKYFYDEPGSAGKYRHEAQGNLFNRSELEVIGNIYENPEPVKRAA